MRRRGALPDGLQAEKIRAALDATLGTEGEAAQNDYFW
jgi:hypothetical protein